MKTLLTVAAVLSLSFAKAQKVKEAELPVKIKEAFAQKYPGAKAEKWEKEGADYEAEFELNKVESSAVFAADGTFRELEQEIKINTLPKNITEYCSKNFADYKIAEAAKITDASGKLMFEAEMSKGKEHFDVLFDEQGTFIKKS